MAMFERFVNFVFFYALVAPALPWLFARKRGLGPPFGQHLIALLLLGLLTVMLWPACVAANCGQGAIAVAMMWGVAHVLRHGHPDGGRADDVFSK